MFDSAQAGVLGRSQRDQPRPLIARRRLLRRELAHRRSFVLASDLFAQLRGLSRH